VGVTSNLDRYRHVANLGFGGMSTVELAEDTLLGRRVALKRLHRDDVRAHSRLRREALIGASLTHPNLVSIFDIFKSDDGDDVIVMEYVEGETLAQRLRRQGKPDIETSLRILAGVSAGLDAIHAQRIVHRDVKPGNILLGVDGSIKLADLGIAAVADRTRITTDGAVLGTFSYMAPEQLEGAVATPAIDIYALAAVAFEILSGQRARKEPNPVALAHAVSTQPPPDLRTVWPEAPEGAAEALIRGMCRDPKGRPRSAGELTARLRAAFEPQTTAPIASQRPARAAAAAAIPVGSAAAARHRSAPPARTASRPPRFVPPPPEKIHRSRGVPMALAGLVLAAIAAAVIFAATSGSPHRASHVSGVSARAPTHRGHTHSTTTRKSTTSTPASAVTPPATQSNSVAASTGSGGGAATAGGSGPVTAVERFYHLAAAHQYSAAWALADPAFRNQLGGYQSFAGGQAADRSIIFDAADVVRQSASGATVYIRTTSIRSTGTQHCIGPVNLVPGTSGWLLDHIDIQCS
jgi:serine/threonine protein kinase